MKKGTLRQARVADLLKETIADILLRKVKDPRVDEVTITGVEVSADLRSAHVYYCVRDAVVRDDALKGLQSAEGFLRHELGHALELRRIPHLIFSFDTSFDYGCHIDELLEKIHEQDEERHN